MLKSPPARFYWVLLVVLAYVLTLATFGLAFPLLLLTAVLAAVSPHARKPALFWPPVVGVVMFIVGFVVTAPISCSSTAVSPGDGVPYTTCTNLVGIDYSGRGLYNPSLVPTLLVAVVAGLAAALLARLVIGRYSHAGRP
jgi:hypothetical protein